MKFLYMYILLAAAFTKINSTLVGQLLKDCLPMLLHKFLLPDVVECLMRYLNSTIFLRSHEVRQCRVTKLTGVFREQSPAVKAKVLGPTL